MKYFLLHEILDRATFEKWGKQGWILFNPDALEALDGLREFFNAPVKVNDWYGGGAMQYRGYRPEDCPVGAIHSEHKKGNAFDCDVKGYTAEEARRIVLENQDNPLLGKIMRMEDKVNWIHFDLGRIPEGKEKIYIFKV
jgi:hypothetical protein